ncbi:hypothetical protein [Fodinibius sediminis]|uniref:hypothetical protein n=1 Tax=Fodinibius sediminis TaxID=1214077 RepID=UPI00163DC24E|nr:hypothetical protein [Fodinibius sediminis]
MTINKGWHKKHPMPEKPTLEQRIEWHIQHAQNCTCRDIPETIKAEIARRKTSGHQ